MKALFALSLCVVFLASSQVEACGRGSMYISNNGYKGMLISISENVDEDPNLITRIREVFTEASAFLYKATR